MKIKFLALVGAGLVAVATAVQSTYAAIAGENIYTLGTGAVASLGGAASDTATSLFGSLASLLPVMIPIIVIGFVIGLVRSFISKRG